jgi:hypothetical protein
MNTVILNPISRKGGKMKMKHHKKHRHVKHVRNAHRRKGIPAGLRRWIKLHHKKHSHKRNPKKQHKVIRHIKHVAKRIRHAVHKGRKRVSAILGKGKTRTRPVWYKMGHNTIKRSPYKKIAYSSMINPFGFTKHIRHKKHSKRRTQFMRNPLNAGMVKNVFKEVPSALYAGAGFVSTDLLMKLPFVSSFILADDMKRIAAKTVGVILLGIGSKMFLKKPDITKMIILGGSLNVLNEIGIKTGVIAQIQAIGQPPKPKGSLINKGTGSLINSGVGDVITGGTGLFD